MYVLCVLSKIYLYFIFGRKCFCLSNLNSSLSFSLSRKRHIGNDIVVIIFLDSDRTDPIGLFLPIFISISISLSLSISFFLFISFICLISFSSFFSRSLDVCVGFQSRFLCCQKNESGNIEKNRSRRRVGGVRFTKNILPNWFLF